MDAGSNRPSQTPTFSFSATSQWPGITTQLLQRQLLATIYAEKEVQHISLVNPGLPPYEAPGDQVLDHNLSSRFLCKILQSRWLVVVGMWLTRDNANMQTVEQVVRKLAIIFLMPAELEDMLQSPSLDWMKRSRSNFVCSPPSGFCLTDKQGKLSI